MAPGMARIETRLYHLALEDGREGTIMVNDVRHRHDERVGDHTAVTFHVSGSWRNQRDPDLAPHIGVHQNGGRDE